MTQKAKLNHLQIESFVTKLPVNASAAAAGGIRVITHSGLYTCPDYCGPSYILECR